MYESWGLSGPGKRNPIHRKGPAQPLPSRFFFDVVSLSLSVDSLILLHAQLNSPPLSPVSSSIPLSISFFPLHISKFSITIHFYRFLFWIQRVRLFFHEFNTLLSFFPIIKLFWAFFFFL